MITGFSGTERLFYQDKGRTPCPVSLLRGLYKEAVCGMLMLLLTETVSANGKERKNQSERNNE